MIDIIGIRKIVFVAFLALLAGVLYLYGFVYLEPQLIKEERKLKASQSEFSQIKANTDNLVIGLEKFETQKDEFNKLRAYGFFDSQNRLGLRLRFDEMQEQSRLLSAKYAISPVEKEKNQLAAEAGFEIIKTKVVFDIDAVEDVDVYKFIYLLNYGFPAQVFVSNVTLNRQVKVTRTLIQRLGGGQPVPIIKAKITAELRTMVEDEFAKQTDEGILN